MLIAITTEGKVGLGVVAGLFLVFAIASSFWLPRRHADFPGQRLGPFVAVTVLLFLAFMAAVIIFAEEEEAGHAGGEAVATEPAETGEGGGGGGEGGGGEGGDAAAGESVFASAGCGGCHTLEAAGTSGSVGPNLDEAQPDFDTAVETVTNGSGAMPAFRDQLSEQQIRDVAAYVAESTS